MGLGSNSHQSERVELLKWSRISGFTDRTPSRAIACGPEFWELESPMPRPRPSSIQLEPHGGPLDWTQAEISSFRQRRSPDITGFLMALASTSSDRYLCASPQTRRTTTRRQWLCIELLSR